MTANLITFEHNTLNGISQAFVPLKLSQYNTFQIPWNCLQEFTWPEIWDWTIPVLKNMFLTIGTDLRSGVKLIRVLSLKRTPTDLSDSWNPNPYLFE